MNRLFSTSGPIALGLAFAAGACAQSLDVTLLDANATVNPGTTVVDFMATLDNPSATATIYINGDSFTTGSPLLSIDDSPFFSDAPLSLAPGKSSGPFELFAADLPASAPPGVYSGNTFEVLGGADNGAGSLFNDLGHVRFSIDIAASSVAAPEINLSSAFAALTLLVGALAAMFDAERSTKKV